MQRLLQPQPHWESKTLGEVCDIKKGSQLNKDRLSSYGNFPVINGGIDASGYYEKYNTIKDTITISEGGESCGYVNYIKSNFWLGGHCYSIKSSLEKKFTYYLLKANQSKIMQMRLGSGLPNIQKKALEKFKIYFPKDLPEQEAIAMILSDMDEELELLEDKLNKYRSLKEGLMQELLTGRIRLV
jgi:type I restriction enzyme S subunit